MDTNMMQLMDEYNTDERCRQYLESLRWPEGVTCVRCESKRVSKHKTRRRYDCVDCKYSFRVTSGTMFHGTRVSLRKWFLAIYLMTVSKKSVAVLLLQQHLKVQYKTAWYMNHRIRAAMHLAEKMPLVGEVEIDETWIGGSRRRSSGNFRRNKSIIVGAVERGGNVRFKVIAHANTPTLHSFINEVVDREHVLCFFTDEACAYNGIGKGEIMHLKVNHSQWQWADGIATTNTIESVWNYLKSCFRGSWQHCSPKHLQAYLDEIEWRYNNTENPFLFRDTCLQMLGTKHMTLKQLISKPGKNPRDRLVF